MGRAPTSKIYSQTRVGYASAHGGRTRMRVAEGKETQEHGGMANVRVDLPKVSRSSFEKN